MVKKIRFAVPLLLLFTAGASHVFAESSTWEFSGGTLGTITINPAASTTGVSVVTGIGVYLRSGVQFTLRPTLSYAVDPVTTNVTWGVLGGPTINFVFADDIKDSVFLFLGIGVNSVNITVSGITTTTVTVPYSLELGKRFSFGNMAYIPGAQINGSTTSAFYFAIVPLRFSFLL